jgi:hypothetical protein
MEEAAMHCTESDKTRQFYRLTILAYVVCKHKTETETTRLFTTAHA